MQREIARQRYHVLATVESLGCDKPGVALRAWNAYVDEDEVMVAT